MSAATTTATPRKPAKPRPRRTTAEIPPPSTIPMRPIKRLPDTPASDEMVSIWQAWAKSVRSMRQAVNDLANLLHLVDDLEQREALGEVGEAFEEAEEFSHRANTILGVMQMGINDILDDRRVPDEVEFLLGCLEPAPTPRTGPDA